MPNTQQLTTEMNQQTSSNQEARINGSSVIIDIFRGSMIRRNRHKVAELKFSLSDIEQAIKDDTFFDLINESELKLNIPLYTIRESVDPSQIA